MNGLGTRTLDRRPGEPPVYTFERRPGAPPVRVVRFEGRELPAGEPVPDHAHAHDFLVLTYFARGGGALRLQGRELRIRTGDVHLIPPGVVVSATSDTTGLAEAEGWGVYFPRRSWRRAPPPPSSRGARIRCSSPSSAAWREVPSGSTSPRRSGLPGPGG